MPEDLKQTVDTTRGFTPAEIVRIHEANCAIDFATGEEQNFRVGWMRLIAQRAGMRELKTAAIIGTGTGVPRPTKEGNRA